MHTGDNVEAAKFETKRFLVRTFREKAYHLACDGELVSTNQQLTSIPGQYIHICQKCKTKVRINGCYPKIVHREEESNVSSI